MKNPFLFRILLSIVQNLIQNTNKNVLLNVRTSYAFKVDSYLHPDNYNIQFITFTEVKYFSQNQNHQNI